MREDDRNSVSLEHIIFLLKIQDQNPYPVFGTENTDTELGLSSGRIKWMRLLKDRMYRQVYRGRKEKRGIIKGKGIKMRKQKKGKQIYPHPRWSREAGCLPNQFVFSSYKAYEMGTILYILQIRKLRLRDSKQLSQVETGFWVECEKSQMIVYPVAPLGRSQWVGIEQEELVFTKK